MNCPDEESILVSMDRVVHCAEELLDELWLGPQKKRRRKRKDRGEKTPESPTTPRFAFSTEAFMRA